LAGCSFYAGLVTQGQQPAPGYFLGADEDEPARLLAQGEARRAQTEGLLDRLNLPAGGRAVDFGCGPLGVPVLDRHGEIDHRRGVGPDARFVAAQVTVPAR
jgi:hypothetical protein